MFIYSFCFSQTCRFHNYKHQQPDAWFSFLVGRGSSNTKYFGPQATFDNIYYFYASTEEARCHWGRRFNSGGGFYRLLSASVGFCRRRSGSVVVVFALWSGTNKNRSFYRRSSVAAGHHQLLSGQVHWKRLKAKVKCTYWPLREP